MFTPMGPGVASEIAIIVVRSAVENQAVRWERSKRNGTVAMPPPMENMPMSRNSQ